jgi:hypothetical protein
MNLRVGAAALAAVLASVATYVGWTSQDLPPLVASHFSFSGKADGFTPRGAYAATMIAFVILIPLLPAIVPGALAGNGAGLNIPNREYWLAPERRAATLAFVRGHGLWLAGALALFLGYAHGLTVHANSQASPALSPGGLYAGLAVFLGGVAAWLGVLFARFRRS